MTVVGKIDHLGIAVANLEEAAKEYEAILGVKRGEIEEVAEQKVRVIMFEVGESRVELLEPTADDSPIAKFLAKKGPGLHHVGYGVEDIHEALKKAKEAGARLLNEEPKKGAHGAQIAFVHPKSLSGVLTEFCQRG